jgi:WD40 repeat protein
MRVVSLLCLRKRLALFSRTVVMGHCALANVADYKSSSLDLASPTTYRDLSKPMGALNTARLDAARARFRDMPRGEGEDPPFFWGTHYSTPGYCLHYLVRTLPEHMLHLQSGKFDAPDRLFFDVSSTWAGVTSTNADVKELTPEWYLSDGAFLQLPDGLDLGVRANGRRVGDVALPPWAFGAADFVARCREALESEIVSSQLHLWIDLIFGFKQRGPAAEAEDNLFYYLTYSDGVDESAFDPERVIALQSQIAEYGQTPRQLFSHRHPSRGEGASVPLLLQGPEPEDSEEVVSGAGATASTADRTEDGAAALTAVDGHVDPGDCSKGIAWQRVLFPRGSSLESSERSNVFLAVHTDTVTRLSASPFGTANAGSLGLHVLSASRDGTVSLVDIIAPPVESHAADDRQKSKRSGRDSSALVSSLCRVTPVAPRPEPSAALSPLMLLWSALQGASPHKPTPVSAAACDTTGAVVFSACWDGSLFAHDAGDAPSVLWHCAAHSAAVSDLVALPLPRRLFPLTPSEGSSGRGEEVPDGEDWYILVTGAWDGSIGLCAVAVCRNASNGAVSVRACATSLAVPGLHSAAVTAISFCGRKSAANFDVVSADAAGEIAWLRIRAHAVAAARGPADSRGRQVVLTCDVLAKCSALVCTSPASKRSAGSDALCGGVSGVTCLSLRPLASTSGEVSSRVRPEPLGILSVACTVEGRLCLLVGTAAEPGSEDRASSRLALLATVATGEVIRCVAVDSSGRIAITGGHRGRLRVWDLRRVRSSCSGLGCALGGPAIELSSADAELASLDVAGEEEESQALSDAQQSCSVPWITACTIVETNAAVCEGRRSASSRDSAGEAGAGRPICLLAGTQSGRIAAYVSKD